MSRQSPSDPASTTDDSGDGINILKIVNRGAWAAQPVKHPTSVQVMISQFMGLSPMSGSVLTAQSLEPALDSMSPSLPLPRLLSLFLSQK